MVSDRVGKREWKKRALDAAAYAQALHSERAGMLQIIGALLERSGGRLDIHEADLAVTGGQMAMSYDKATGMYHFELVIEKEPLVETPTTGLLDASGTPL